MCFLKQKFCHLKIWKKCDQCDFSVKTLKCQKKFMALKYQLISTKETSNMKVSISSRMSSWVSCAAPVIVASNSMSSKARRRSTNYKYLNILPRLIGCLNNNLLEYPDDTSSSFDATLFCSISSRLFWIIFRRTNFQIFIKLNCFKILFNSWIFLRC